LSSTSGSDLFRLDGQVALVTGGARGLGQAMATALAQAGAAVCVADILPADETLTQITAAGQPGHALVTDLAALDPDGADALMQRVAKKLGPPSILVNNAGIIRRAPAMTHSWEDWQQTITLDLSAPFLLSQALARQLVAREAPGKIVNIASMLSYQGGYLVPGYTAAKSGIAGLTRALANEWARYGINVNAIAPGYMATELTAMLRSDPGRAETMLARIPAGRWGEPEDLAGAMIFLCSCAADYVHGTVLPIDGGWLSW
jgi:2-deoxy-D-gluconate 3-dehydrogenase